MAVTTPNEQRDRLTQLRERTARLRQARANARKAIDVAREVKDEDAMAVARAAESQAQDELEIVGELERAVLGQMSGSGAQDFGSALRDNPAAQEVLRELSASSAPIRAEVHLGPLMSMDETLALTGRYLAAPVGLPSPSNSRDGGFLGIAPTPVAPTSLLDVFRSVPFEGRKAEFLRRNGIADAAIQVEGQVKHEASLSYLDAEASAETVAAWSKVRRQQLDDIDQLAADLAVALRAGVLREVEELLVQSTPISGAPSGIMNTTGIVAPTITAGTPLPEVIGKLKATLAVTGVVANFAAAHPLAIEDEEARTESGSGAYVNSIDDQGRIRRLPLVPSTALGVDDVLVGDSRIGARLGVREPVRLVISQESDDLIKNMVTALAEGRWAPIVDVPGAFAKGTLS